MNNITNDCRFLGRLVSDPNLIRTKNDVDLVTFTLAVPEYRKERTGEKKRNVSYFDFEAWDSAAKTIKQRAQKDDIMVIEAIARNESIKDPDTVVFRITNFKIIPKRRS